MSEELFYRKWSLRPALEQSDQGHRRIQKQRKTGANKALNPIAALWAAPGELFVSLHLKIHIRRKHV